jgi:NCS1 family nucleobase:cation symporter-1
VYAVGLLAQLPFLSTHFYTGPLVEWLGGADISWVVGLAVPALLYWLLARRDTTHIRPGRSCHPNRTRLPGRRRSHRPVRSHAGPGPRQP